MVRTASICLKTPEFGASMADLDFGLIPREKGGAAVKIPEWRRINQKLYIASEWGVSDGMGVGVCSRLFLLRFCWSESNLTIHLSLSQH